MTEPNEVPAPEGRVGPRVIHLPVPRKLLSFGKVLPLAIIAVTAMTAPAPKPSAQLVQDRAPASTTVVTAASDPGVLTWLDEAAQDRAWRLLPPLYAVPPAPSAPALVVPAVAFAAAPVSGVAVPQTLWAAYVSAVAAMPASCHLDPHLLAAIGQLESGSLWGRSIDAQHRAVPPVLGPVLDGGPYASIPDTDHGRWDGNTTWDRAVGPMQFIPSTWARYGRDANGDGVAEPQNVDDAALSAATYLCASGGDLSQPADLRAAILAYNHSDAYLQGVLSLMGRVAPGGAGPLLAAPALLVAGSTAQTPAATTAPSSARATASPTATRPSASGSPTSAPSSATTGTPTTSGSASSTSATTSAPGSATSTTGTTTSTATQSTTTSPTSTATCTANPSTSSTTSATASPTGSPTTSPSGSSASSSTTSPATSTTATSTTPTATGPSPNQPEPSTSSSTATEEALASAHPTPAPTCG